MYFICSQVRRRRQEEEESRMQSLIPNIACDYKPFSALKLTGYKYNES